MISPSAAPTSSREERHASSERQVVALRLAEEVYGIDIAIVHTVIVPPPITVVPKTPEAIRGVMNLRGRILPVIDLRTRFDLPSLSAEAARSGRVIIVDVEGTMAGLVVDGVSEVLSLDASLIQPPAGILASGIADCITGVGKVPRRDGEATESQGLILLLDVLRVITPGLDTGPGTIAPPEMAEVD